MQQLQEKQSSVVDKQFVHTMAMLRAAFQLNVGKHLLLVTDNKVMSEPIKRAKNTAINAIDDLVIRIHSIHKQPDAAWLERNLGEEKTLDVARLIDTLTRIGEEETDEKYNEFLGICIDVIMAIFYAQENRRNLHFGKYKALFKLFTDEMQADISRQPGQLWFREGKIWLRTSQPDHPIKLTS